MYSIAPISATTRRIKKVSYITILHDVSLYLCPNIVAYVSIGLYTMIAGVCVSIAFLAYFGVGVQDFHFLCNSHPLPTLKSITVASILS